MLLFALVAMHSSGSRIQSVAISRALCSAYDGCRSLPHAQARRNNAYFYYGDSATRAIFFNLCASLSRKPMLSTGA